MTLSSRDLHDTAAIGHRVKWLESSTWLRCCFPVNWIKATDSTAAKPSKLVKGGGGITFRGKSCWCVGVVGAAVAVLVVVRNSRAGDNCLFVKVVRRQQPE